MELTRATKFYFNMGETISLICDLIRGNRGISALNPVVRGGRIISSLGSGNIEIVSSPYRYRGKCGVIVHARKIRGDIVRSVRDESVPCIGTAYPFILGVRGVIDRERPNNMALVTNSTNRPRILKVHSFYANRDCIFEGRTRLLRVVGDRGVTRGGSIVYISRAAFDLRR